MANLDTRDAVWNADNTVNPAFLAASMIDERAPDRLSTTCLKNLQSRFYFICHPTAPLKSSISRALNANANSSR